MAKTSAIERNLKRIKMSNRFASKREKLKAIIRNKKLPRELINKLNYIKSKFEGARLRDE